VANPTSTPSVTFSLTNAAGYSWYGNSGSGSGAPGYHTTALPASLIPNPSASTLGGIESLAAVSHKWLNTISTGGVPSATQPASSDLSDYGSIPNAALANTGVTVNTSAPLGGGGSVALGGTLTLTCIGCLVPSATQYALAYYPTTISQGSLAPPATQGQFFTGYWNTTGAASAPQNFQIGFTALAADSLSSVPYTACSGQQLQYTGAVSKSLALPTATTLNDPLCGFAVLNATTGSATTVTLNLTIWLINGSSALTVVQNELCWIYVDPAGGKWDAMCHMTSQRP
jgi:hypothetical protein